MARKQKKKRKTNRRFKFFRFIFLLLLLTSILLSVCLFSPFFNIAKVNVQGNDQLSAEEIEASSGIIKNTNIFKMNKNYIEENLYRISYVDGVEIKRRLPQSVLIAVTETYPQLIFPYMTGYLITNENAKVLEMTDDISSYEIPQILGVDVNNAKICEKISVQDDVTFDIIKRCIYTFYEKNALGMFRSIDFSNIASFHAYTHDGVKVIFGKISDIEYKLSVLEAVISQVDRTEGTYIDLTAPASSFVGREENNTAAKPTAAKEQEAKETGEKEGAE